MNRILFFQLIILFLPGFCTTVMAGESALKVATVNNAMVSYVTFAVTVTAVKIVALILGYFVVKLGFTTMMAGVKGDDSVKLSAFGTGFEFKGVTPGLALAIVGVLLMGWALSTKHQFKSEVKNPSVLVEPGQSLKKQMNRNGGRHEAFKGLPEK